MPFDSKLWQPRFPTDSAPPLPCPACDHGRLTLRRKDVLEEVPFQSDDEFDPENCHGRFGALMRCRGCGQIVALSGMTIPIMRDGELDHDLQPKSMYPRRR